MAFLDRLIGGDDADRPTPPVPQNAHGRQGSIQPPPSQDELAIERYRYLLRTAPPETIEQVHAEAFAKLTEPQRQQVLADLSAGLPASEQPRSSDPQSMARAATRGEYMNPGFMERTLGPQRQGPSFGSMLGSSILGTVVGYVIGSTLVSAFLAPPLAHDEGNQDGSAQDDAADAADPGGTDTGADAAPADTGGRGDPGSGWGGEAAADA
ncbi:hypothetical protein, partial [Microbacterium sp. CPCC 204701]|uniref:hypothetical protein n=1 Tax=Microbacterium sp. CPCC 204701 TaxID=2493084 RepID=UPI000FDBFFE3